MKKIEDFIVNKRGYDASEELLYYMIVGFMILMGIIVGFMILMGIVVICTFGG